RGQGPRQRAQIAEPPGGRSDADEEGEKQDAAEGGGNGERAHGAGDERRPMAPAEPGDHHRQGREVEQDDGQERAAGQRREQQRCRGTRTDPDQSELHHHELSRYSCRVAVRDGSKRPPQPSAPGTGPEASLSVPRRGRGGSRAIALADHVGQEPDEAAALDRLGELALLLGRDRGDAGRHDLAALRDVTLKELHVLVVDLRRIGARERAGLAAAEEGTARAALSCECHVLLLRTGSSVVVAAGAALATVTTTVTA